MTVRAPAIWNARRSPRTPFSGLIYQAGVARRQDGPLRALQVERRDFLGGQDAVLLIARAARRRLAPASTRPDSSSGLSGEGPVDGLAADSLPTARVPDRPVVHAWSRKKP